MADNNKASGGNQGKRPVNKPPSKRKTKKSNAAMWTWVAIGVVVAIVAAFVVVKTTQSDSKGGKYELVKEPVKTQVTTIPASVYDSVGITSGITVYPPTVKKGQPPLYYIENGKKVPGGFYWGAEYCPYCAATRWGIIAAYSRFGTFDKLYTMSSAPNDYAPNTPTFSFVGTTFNSPYTAFRSFEVVGPLNDGTILQHTPPREERLVRKYNSKGYFPFLDVGNKVFYIGTAYDPTSLAGQTREEIAANLDDPTNPVTQAIVATANYITAGICATNHAQPGSVCHSSGVQAAATALHLSF